MKHFKKPDNTVYAFESDGSQDSYITPDMVLLSDADLAALRVTQTTAPTAITMRQARLALLSAGLLDAVQAGVSAMPKAAQIEWEFAATVDRTSPLVSTLAAALGLDDAALDALFSSGAEL